MYRLRVQSEAGRRQANTLIDAFIDEGGCEFNGSFAVPLPCSVFLSLFGLPTEDLRLFLDMKDGIIRPHTKTQDLEEMARIVHGRQDGVTVDEVVGADDQSVVVDNLDRVEVVGRQVGDLGVEFE